jgi:tol-pal system protein YbgF
LTEPTPADPEVPAAAQAIYDHGYTLYHEGRYLEAETAFQRFLTGWGVSPLADNALFWIGASRLARGEVDTALAAFTEVTTRYPDENKVADALLKMAEIAERSGDHEGARNTYRRLVTDHAESAAAAVALERLERP